MNHKPSRSMDYHVESWKRCFADSTCPETELTASCVLWSLEEPYVWYQVLWIECPRNHLNSATWKKAHLKDLWTTLLPDLPNPSKLPIIIQEGGGRAKRQTAGSRAVHTVRMRACRAVGVDCVPRNEGDGGQEQQVTTALEETLKVWIDQWDQNDYIKFT